MDIQYHYRARNKAGESVTGLVEAASLEVAQKILTDNGLTVISLEKPRTFLEVFGFHRKVSVKQRAFLARQLSTMLNAGLPLPQVLNLLMRSERHPVIKQVIGQVQQDLEQGFSFSTSIAKHPELFSRVFVNAVRAGEATGKLEVVLDQLSDTLERDASANARFRSIMIYPIFVVSAMIVVGAIMMVKVIPVLSGVFDQAHTQLPLATRLLITISTLVQHWWFALLVLAAVLIFFLRAWVETERGKRQLDYLKIKLPGLKKISQMYYMARFSRTLGMLVTAGVPLLEGLRITADAIDNSVLKDILEKASLQVERGIPLSTTLGKAEFFPPLVIQMILTGEETGQLDKVLTKVSLSYEEEYDTVVKSASTLLEPVIIILLGLGVGFLVFAIIIPIYQVSMLQ